MAFKFYNPGKIQDKLIRNVCVSLRLPSGWAFVEDDGSKSYDLIHCPVCIDETPCQAGLRILKEKFERLLDTPSSYASKKLLEEGAKGDTLSIHAAGDLEVIENRFNRIGKKASLSKDKEVQNFLDYCDSIDSDLFVEACESFSGEELNELQNNLDTDDYQRTIKIFTERIKDIAKQRLEEICDYADSEIRTHELTIEMAQRAIANIHQELEESIKKPSSNIPENSLITFLEAYSILSIKRYLLPFKSLIRE